MYYLKKKLVWPHITFSDVIFMDVVTFGRARFSNINMSMFTMYYINAGQHGRILNYCGGLQILAGETPRRFLEPL